MNAFKRLQLRVEWIILDAYNAGKCGKRHEALAKIFGLNMYRVVRQK